MLDLDTLSVFTPENGIYGGVNKTNFKSIELWLQTIKDKQNRPSVRPNSLGLFGPASTGKTSTASLVAKTMKLPLISLNSAALNQSNFWESLYSNATQNHKKNGGIWEVLLPIFRCGSNNTKKFVLKNCVILLDECHALTARSQAQLLTLLDGSTSVIPNAVEKTHCVEFRNVSWILSTTDSGKLLYPLSTRLHSIVLNEYTEDDVVEIVKMNYPVLEEGSALVLARAAKLVPRIALSLTEQYISIFRNSCYTRQTALSYVNSIRQTNEYGLDNTDEKILAMLKMSKTGLPKAKQMEKHLLTIKLSKFDLVVNPSEEQLSEAIKLQTLLESYEEQEAQAPNMPRSRQDISTYCRLYDMRDLELRLGYMEKLGVVTKTKSGILWKKDVT